MTPLAMPPARRPWRIHHLRWRCLLLPVALLLLTAAAHADSAAVQVQRVDSALRVQASALLHADVQTVWNTLVGYERLPEFIPDMASSRTLRRDGDNAVLQQRGRAGLGPFKRDFSLTLAVQEAPLRSVKAQAVAGDFSRFESSYQLQTTSDGIVRLEYAALIEPKAGIPPLVGVPVMEHAIRRQFDALVAEIERRAGSASASRAAAARATVLAR
jgi:ribosome-associated toxin RatA of RatAB toxin-antitoxin module